MPAAAAAVGVASCLACACAVATPRPSPPKSDLHVHLQPTAPMDSKRRVSPREKKPAGLSLTVSNLTENPKAPPVPEPALENAALDRQPSPTGSNARTAGDKVQVLVLVGMRGSGKTSNGRAAAAALDRDFVDLDHVLEAEVGCTIPAYIAANDWPTFRAKEAEILLRALRCEPLGVATTADADSEAEVGPCMYKTFGVERGAVIACGGGVVETPSSVEALHAHRGVVIVDRHIDDIVSYLEGAGSYRPGLGEHPSVVYERRLPLYKRCADWCFTILPGACLCRI